MRDGFEPDVAETLTLMRAAGRPPFETLSVEEARSLYRAGRDTVHLPSIAVASVDQFVLGGRSARRYRPVTHPTAATILYFHGGGYVIGDLDTHDSICRHLARASGVEVVALDYRLAPEHPFPAAFDDCRAAYAALAGEGRPIALAGDSAGGTLALAVAIAARDGGVVTPSALALFYPVADVGDEAPSYAAVGGVPITGATMRWFWRQYLPDMTERRDWRASPLRADLAGLPPTFITTCGHDPLHDEGQALIAALRAAGGSVIHRDLPGQIHGYLTLGRLIGEAERSLAAAGAFLAAHLETGSAPPA